MEGATVIKCCSPDIVRFSEGDPEDPINWSSRKKQAVVLILCVLSFVQNVENNIQAPGQPYLMLKYNISIDLASSGLSFYVLGFAMGPLICAPLSELYGRKLPYMLSWPLLIAATAPSAFADNIAIILLFRFFTGCCAGCSINNGTGVVADMYHNDKRAQAKAVACYAFSPLSGPCFGSLIGFFVAAAGWHGLWVVRVHLYACLVCWPLVFLLPETHGPTILGRRALALRFQGHIHAFSREQLEPMTLRDIIQRFLLRPAKMLIYEPICQGAAIWIGLAYGIVYFFFEVYPIVFIVQHKIPFHLCGVMFLFIPIGMLIVLALFQPLAKLFARLPLPGIVPKDMPLAEPESRLMFALSACAAMPISLFWFGWSSGPETHWIVPALAGILFGYSMTAIFMCFLAYMAEIYTVYSSSAVAANAFMRSIIAAIFPVITHSIIKATGTKWGLSLFASLSLGLIPIPLIFIRHGKELRARSRYAREAQDAIKQMGAYDVEEAKVFGTTETLVTRNETNDPVQAGA
ncbi:MFS general substrate transporter [Russula brevipes]|nr:MFS general substrate transporter [Russula brevipes]